LVCCDVGSRLSTLLHWLTGWATGAGAAPAAGAGSGDLLAGFQPIPAGVL